MNIISIHMSHGSSIVFYNNNQYHTIEFERLVKKRYKGLISKEYKDFDKQFDMVLDRAKELWGIENDFDICTLTNLSENLMINKGAKQKIDYIKAKVKAKQYIGIDHHLSHAANSFYMSQYKEALIVSFDGSGNDGVFNVYIGSEKGLELIKKFDVPSMGKAYRRPCYVIDEVRKSNSDGPVHPLSLSGKLMGLSAYGRIRTDWVDAFKSYYNDLNSTERISNLSRSTGISFLDDGEYKDHINNGNVFKTYSGQISYDIARTNQHAFEEAAIERIMSLASQYNLPICLAGGCALNVLLNERIRLMFGDNVFVPPNPDDCGIALGQSFYVNPPNKHELDGIVYSGIPMLDRHKLQDYVIEYNATKADHMEVAKLIKAGNIIGICIGNSEIGPRALGNRSIICDASIKGMKDKINTIKQREWFRPFGPIVKEEDADKYFHFTHKSPYMSYAPRVREEYQDRFPAVTHVDGTARLQTVTTEQHPFIYALLVELDGILLNTSFNIKGKPILSEIKDALLVLEDTALDYVYIEGYLFKKKGI